MIKILPSGIEWFINHPDCAEATAGIARHSPGEGGRSKSTNQQINK
jgi:hypothetical protein